MTTPPRLCLDTPAAFEPAAFADLLARALDAGDVASVRLRQPDASEDELRVVIDLLLPVCHQRDAALLIVEHYRLAHETGLDGVHFEPGPNAQIEARRLLGENAVIGVGCGASRHHAMVAGERGADYIAFGPLAADPAPATGEIADRDLFEWWQTLIEIPVLAEGGVTPELATGLAGAADFVAAGRAVWRHPDGPAAGVRAFLDAFARGATT